MPGFIYMWNNLLVVQVTLIVIECTYGLECVLINVFTLNCALVDLLVAQGEHELQSLGS